MGSGATIDFVIIAGFGIVGLILAMVFAFPQNSVKKDIHKRAKKFAANKSGKTKAGDVTVSSLRKSQEKSVLINLFAGLPTLRNIRAKIAQLNGEYTLQSFLSNMVMVFAGCLVVFLAVAGMKLFLALILALVLSFVVPNFLLNRKLAKRNKKFLLLMPDALDLIVRGLRSGLPVTESMQSIVDGIGEPIRSLFLEITSSVRMGASFENSLYEAAEKLGLNEFNFFAISVALQRETGGNLAEILENLSETIRARTMMKLKIRAISSEARASAYIVGALPFIVMAVLLAMSPDYLDPLFETLKGNIALAVAMGMFSFGMFVMNKMASMEV